MKRDGDSMHARVAKIKRDHTRHCVTLPQIRLRTVREQRTERTGVNAPGDRAVMGIITARLQTMAGRSTAMGQMTALEYYAR